MNALAALEGGHERFILEERAVLDRLADPGQILVEAAAGADRQVPDLRVAHLAGGQPDGLSRGNERRVRVGRPEPVEYGRVRERDRVPRSRWSTAPAVEDDERYERAASQIPANDSTSRDAPPTSAPSTSGCDRSSSAFSGFTEPP